MRPLAGAAERVRYTLSVGAEEPIWQFSPVLPDGRGIHACNHDDCRNFDDRRIRRLFWRDGPGIDQPAESYTERYIMGRTLFLAAALIGVTSSLAFEQFRGSPSEQAACRRDAVHFCRGMSDDMQVENCLLQHRQRLSGSCRAVFQAHGR